MPPCLRSARRSSRHHTEAPPSRQCTGGRRRRVRRGEVPAVLAQRQDKIPDMGSFRSFPLRARVYLLRVERRANAGLRIGRCADRGAKCHAIQSEIKVPRRCGFLPRAECVIPASGCVERILPTMGETCRDPRNAGAPTFGGRRAHASAVSRPRCRPEMRKPARHLAARRRLLRAARPEFPMRPSRLPPSR